MQRRRPPRPPVDGVLLLDKPAGLSSNAALGRARRLLESDKAGHGGTLDPLASGLLPVLLGEATKFAADLLDADKRYEALLQLGARSTTGDAEGELVDVREVRCTEDDVRAACAAFTGSILQVPPMHSALKRDGRALYEYAREGVTLERAPRAVTIHAIELLEWAALAGRVRLDVRCSKGTYIRTLAEDIGERLGCGAWLAGLRRTGAGPLVIGEAVTLDALEALDAPARKAVLRPMDHLLRGLPAVSLSEHEAARFVQGQRLRLEAARMPAMPPAPDDEDGTRVRVHHADRLLGIGGLDACGRLAPKRLVAQRDDAVPFPHMNDAPPRTTP